jgi:hypothetical protein
MQQTRKLDVRADAFALNGDCAFSGSAFARAFGGV